MNRFFEFLRSGRVKYVGLVILVALATGVAYFGVARHSSTGDAAHLKGGALQAYRAADYKHAIPEFESYLVSNANDVQTRNLLEASYVQTGHLDKALELAKGTLKFTADDPDLYYRMANYADRLGRISDSVAFLEKAVGLKPSPAFRSQLARAYTKARRYDNATEEWRVVLDALPQDAPERNQVREEIAQVASLKTK
ncbi:MAG: hypothetical protein M1335_06920 [Chloroflexi bacterium]|nr:hypothetical protein [Chloroflexota bacterium]